MLEDHGAAFRRPLARLAGDGARAFAALGQSGAAAARADDAEDFLVTDGKIELPESDDRAVEEKLARILGDNRVTRRLAGLHRLALLPADHAARPDLPPDLGLNIRPVGDGVKRPGVGRCAAAPWISSCRIGAGEMAIAPSGLARQLASPPCSTAPRRWSSREELPWWSRCAACCRRCRPTTRYQVR